MTKAFGKFHPGENLKLRGFEVYFGIYSRTEPGSWKSIYPSVQNLLDHLARQSKSEGSKESYLNVLKRFCITNGHSPDELITFSKKHLKKITQEYVDEKLRSNLSRTYVNMVLKRIRTFYRVNVVDNLDLHGYYQPTRYRKRPEYIPTKSEIFSMANAASNTRDQVIILSLWSCGLRVSTFCALDYGDVREELESNNQIVKIPVYPGMKQRVHHACKGDIPYFSFICSEATEALRIYLTERTEQFGEFHDSYPLFHSDWHLWDRTERSSKRIGRRGISLILKRAARLSGISQWKYITPHSMRKAFESVLRNPTTDSSRLDKGTQEFLFGHILSGSQDPYYDKTKIEYHREEYAKLDFSLTPKTSRSQDKLIKMHELESHFSDGWIFVSTISDNLAVVRKSIL